MRKWTTATLVAALVLGVASPAFAGPVKVRPNPVEHGEKLKIKAKNCVSGPGYEAFVEVEIVDAATDETVDEFRVPADDDGTTKIKTKIKAKKYPPGKYIVYVWCIHEFDAGGEGTWYEEQKTITVVEGN